MIRHSPGVCMRRVIGFLLVLHGLAHAGVGMWLNTSAPASIVSLLWWLATIGFIAAGTGLLGVPLLDRYWRILSSIAAVASLALIALSSVPVLMIGAAIDGAILLDGIPFVHESTTRVLGVPLHPSHRRLGRITGVALVLLMAYISAVLVARPWYTRWGVSDAERAMRLTGNPQVMGNGYRQPSLAAVPLAPIGLLIFEPAHFIMQRRMLLGIKARAETSRGIPASSRH